MSDAAKRWYQAQPQEPVLSPCNCAGPQDGQPLCPCQMRSLVVKNGRYVRPEQDLGPAPDAAAIAQQRGSGG